MRESPVLLGLEDGSLRPSPGDILARQLHPIRSRILREQKTLHPWTYSSHSVWQSKAMFELWTKSEAIRLAHRDAGQNKLLYLDHPQFEGFEVRQTVRRGEDAVA